jgi:hypothetical protein
MKSGESSAEGPAVPPAPAADKIKKYSSSEPQLGRYLFVKDMLKQILKANADSAPALMTIDETVNWYIEIINHDPARYCELGFKLDVLKSDIAQVLRDRV